MNRALPWILAALFALLFAVSLVTRGSSETSSSPSSKTVNERETIRALGEIPRLPSRVASRSSEEPVPPEASSKEERFRFGPEGTIRDQLREELEHRYIGSPPSMSEAVGKRLDEAVPALIEILRDPTWGSSGRYRAALLLLKHHVPGTKRILDDLLDDKKVRNYMVGLLATHGDETSALKMAEVYEDSDGSTQDSIIRAMAFLGHAEGTEFVEKALKQDAEDLPGLLAALEEKDVAPEDILYGIESRKRELEFYHQAITAAASNDVVTTAIPTLYAEALYAKEWGLHVLSKRRPPTLALHLRAAMDVQKKRPIHRRSLYDLGFEWKLLTVLKDLGGTLTPSEEAYLRDYGKPGCDLPRPSE